MKKVLIVEDAKMIQKILTGIFTSHGFQVVGVANNGLEAIDMYFKLKPDLTTLDIRMPQMDGLEALKEMTFRDATAKEKVGGKFMMVTSVDDDIKAVRRAGLYGASDYVKKPFKTEELLERVNRVLNEGYNFVKEAVTQGETEDAKEDTDSSGTKSYVIDSKEERSPLDPSLKESIDEITEDLSELASSLIQSKNQVSGEDLSAMMVTFDRIGTKLELDQLNETASFCRTVNGFIKKIESCGLPFEKREVDLLLASIDSVEDALEYIQAHNGEEGIEENITGKTMLKLMKRL